MSLQEAVQQVSYVTTAGGHPTAVQVQIEVWEQIVALLQTTLPTTEATTAKGDSEDAAWDLFLTLSDDAQPGAMKDPSLHHDTYLYGQAA